MKTNKFVFASLALLVVTDASAGFDVEKIEQARDILSKADFREYK